MNHGGSRRLGVGLLTSACVGLLGLTSMLNAPFAFGDGDTALIMGFAGTPDPDQSYVDEVMSLFIPATPNFPGQPVFPGYDPVVQTTIEDSDYYGGLTQGVADLNQGITQQLADENNVVVFGYSESSSIATQEMVNLDSLPADQQPNPADLSFVIAEDLNNPNGGSFARFPELGLPATPADSPYPTDIYSLEYSGVADFPNYPLDPFALANAIAGYAYLHPFLLPGWPTTFDTSALADAVQEPTSPGYDGATEYFLIPTQDLPLLEPLREIPLIGPAMADLIQPDLRVLVDLGYDRADPSDVATPAQLTLPDIDWTTVMQNLELGAQQGLTAAEVDLGLLAQSDLPDAYPYLPDVSGLMSDPGMTGLITDPSAASVPTLSALLGDLGGNLDLSNLLSGLTTLLANPLDLFSL
jgi:diacyltrehalose acyltransferase